MAPGLLASDWWQFRSIDLRCMRGSRSALRVALAQRLFFSFDTLECTMSAVLRVR
jgi:hypothetical protein